MTTRRRFLKQLGGIGGTALIGAQAATLGTGGAPAFAVRDKPPPEKPLRASHGQAGNAPTPTPTPTPTEPVTPVSPEPTPTTVSPGFVLARTQVSYATFYGAHAAAQDGDTILVQPTMYAMQTNGWTITKSITLKSTVPGKRYAIKVLRDPTSGAIGSGINVDGWARYNAGMRGRLKAAVEDAEVYADGLTYETGKAAVYVTLHSNTCPVDATFRRCFIHDYDQGIESTNEYNPADRTSTITVEDSIVYQTGTIGSGDANHCLYIGFCASLTMRGCIVETKAKQDWIGPNYDTAGNLTGPNYWPVGHLVKCRAKALTIEGCRLTADDTTATNCIEYGNGGDLLVTGTIMEVGTRAEGNGAISYGRFFASRNPNTTYNEVISMDGRVNRLRVFQNTIVNADARPNRPKQFVELSYRTTQAWWTAKKLGAVPTDMTLAENQAIENNVFVDAAANGILPSQGYPGVGTGNVDGVLCAVGIPCKHAVNNTAKLTYADLVNHDDRYAGWRLKTPMQGSANRAPFVLVDVPADAYGTRSPSVTARKDAFYGAAASAAVSTATASAAPSWYSVLPVNAWSHLPITTLGQEVCKDTNPSGIIWPSTSVNEPYDVKKPLVAGKHPIPGSSGATYNVFSGGRMIPNLTFVRNGVTYSGTYWVRYGGGHAASPDNSLHAIGPFDGTPRRINITDPSIPPAIDLSSDGNATSTWAPDGWPGAAHTYNSFAYLRSLNTLVIGQGAGYNEAKGALYAYRFDEDGGTNYPNANGVYMTPAAGWLRNQDYWESPGLPSQEAAWMVDNLREEVWVIPQVTTTPYAYKASFAEGSPTQRVEVTDLERVSQNFYKKGWAIEGERWLVFMVESEPRKWYLIDRDTRNQYGRIQVFTVTFTGDPLPPAVGGSDSQPTAGSAYDYEQRCFYVWSAGSDPAVVAADVYKIVPPPTDQMATQPWMVTKISPTAGIVPEAPFGGLQYQHQTGATNIGGWSAYGNFEFVPSPTRGLFFHHRGDVPPLFWRLS